MSFSKTELKLLEQVALGNNQVSDVAFALKKDSSQIYRVIKSLSKKGFLHLDDSLLKPIPSTHVQLLLQELARQPSFIDNLSGCGMKLYSFLLDEPKTVDEIVAATNIKRSMIFYKFKKAYRNNFIQKIDTKYRFNDALWPRIKEFLQEYQQFENTNDKRIPPGSIIYSKSPESILFSTKSLCDASSSGFSAYNKFGIKIYTMTNTYYLPKKELSKQEVFLDSLTQTEKEPSIQNKILLAIFYLKHKKDLTIPKNKLIININKVLEEKIIKGYPTYAEIRQRAEMYGVVI